MQIRIQTQEAEMFQIRIQDLSCEKYILNMLLNSFTKIHSKMSPIFLYAKISRPIRVQRSYFIDQIKSFQFLPSNMFNQSPAQPIPSTQGIGYISVTQVIAYFSPFSLGKTRFNVRNINVHKLEIKRI